MILQDDEDQGLLKYPMLSAVNQKDSRLNAAPAASARSSPQTSKQQSPLLIELDARPGVDICELRPTTYALPLLSLVIGIILFVVLPSLGYDSFVLPIPAFFCGIGLLFLALYRLISFEFDRKHRVLTIRRRRAFTSCCPSIRTIPFNLLHSVQVLPTTSEDATVLRTVVILVVDEDDAEVITGTDAEVSPIAKSWMTYIASLDRRQPNRRHT